MFHQVVYVSSAVSYLSAPELAALLRQSRENNARDGITGMLLYHGGTFMQAYEGVPGLVEALRTRIAADARHRGLVELFRGEVEERHFGEWTMGFYAGSEIVQAEPGFHDLASRDLPPPLREAALGRARTLLTSFQRRMAR